MSTIQNNSVNPLIDKFRDINTPGFVARLTPDEADEIFFDEPAISDEDALMDAADLVDDE